LASLAGSPATLLPRTNTNDRAGLESNHQHYDFQVAGPPSQINSSTSPRNV